MITQSELVQKLASALGLSHWHVEETARHLREAGMLAAGEAQATVEHAVTLLIGLMAAPEPKDAPDSVRLYAQLPLCAIDRAEITERGTFESVRLAEDHQFVCDMLTWGGHFGEFLANLVRAFMAAYEITVEPGAVLIGGGPGTASASVEYSILADGAPVGGSVRFNLEPLGGGQRPDDAPRARLDSFATVSGAIFVVLREFFVGDDGPRHVNLSEEQAREIFAEL